MTLRTGWLTDWKAVCMVLGLCTTTLLSGCTGTSKAEDGLVQQVVNDPLTPSDPTPTTPPPSGPGPTLAFAASPMVIDEGATTTLSWSTSNADTCTASGGWSGSRDPSGSETVGPLSAGTTYSLSCSGPDGSVLDMISVGVVGPVELSWVAPTENVDGSTLTDLDRYRIYYGGTSRSYSDMIELADSGATSHTLSLASGDYYVAMTALDADGNESAYSNEVLKTRP
jgi:hypothetical protein